MADEYAEGRDFMSATKVNYCHYILKHLLGFNVHPSISSSLARSQNTIRIADFGTQTAVWALDVAEDQSLENVEVHGFDKSIGFFPPEFWRPKNVKLSKQDVYEPFATELENSFDMVHLRFFLTMTKDQVQKILASAIRILKPGGYVQWTEHDKPSVKLIARPGAPHTEAVEAFIRLEMDPFPGYNATWVNDLASGFTTAGLELLSEERAKTKPSFLTQFNTLHLLSIADVPAGLSTAIDDFREKHLESLKDAYADGVSTVDSFLTVVGRKPES